MISRHLFLRRIFLTVREEESPFSSASVLKSMSFSEMLTMGSVDTMN